MLRSKFKFSNVAALLALVFAIGGGAYAATKIDGSEIRKGSIEGNRLAKQTVKGGKIVRKTIKQTHLNTTLLDKIKRKNQKPVFFHTTEPGNTLSIGAGDPLEFSGVQLGRGIQPVSDNEYKFEQHGSYRVTLVLSIAKVNIPGTLLFTLDGVPSHLLSGNPTVGAQLVLDGVVIADKDVVLSVISETGLNVQLSSGTEATLTIERLGGGVKPIREAADPNAPPEG